MENCLVKTYSSGPLQPAESDLNAVMIYSLYSIPLDEFVAVVSGRNLMLQQYANDDITLVEGIHSNKEHIVNGEIVEDGYSLPVLKRKLLVRVTQDAQSKRNSEISTSFGLTSPDINLMALPPRNKKVTWNFSTGPKTLSSEEWEKFLEEVWDHFSIVGEEEQNRYSLISKAVNKEELLDLATELNI